MFVVVPGMLFVVPGMPHLFVVPGMPLLTGVPRPIGPPCCVPPFRLRPTTLPTIPTVPLVVVRPLPVRAVVVVGVVLRRVRLGRHVRRVLGCHRRCWLIAG